MESANLQAEDLLKTLQLPRSMAFVTSASNTSACTSLLNATTRRRPWGTRSRCLLMSTRLRHTISNPTMSQGSSICCIRANARKRGATARRESMQRTIENVYQPEKSRSSKSSARGYSAHSVSKLTMTSSFLRRVKTAAGFAHFARASATAHDAHARTSLTNCVRFYTHSTARCSTSVSPLACWTT